MRLIYLSVVYSFLLSCSAAHSVVTSNPKTAASQTWDLIFQDEFNTAGSFDSSKWEYCQRKPSAWSRYLTQSSDYAFQEGGNLVLKMDGKAIPVDSVPYHSGGVQTKGKFSFTYGKVEVRAKFTGGRGSWPAIWMMPADNSYGGWPRSGEIDIMEHVNNERMVHQTIHNASVTNSAGGSTATKSTAYDSSDYNLYGIVWMEDKIEFYVDNALQYTYNKPTGATKSEWPFDQPFYIILNQSGGAGWPGPITNADLPFTMHVDWVKVYQKKKGKKHGISS